MRRILCLIVIAALFSGCQRGNMDTDSNLLKTSNAPTKPKESTVTMEPEVTMEPTKSVEPSIPVEPSVVVEMTFQSPESDVPVTRDPRCFVLMQEFTSICNEMDQRQITLVESENPQTLYLFQRLFTNIECEWFCKDFIDKIENGDSFTNYYQGVRFFHNVLNESDKNQDNILYGMEFTDLNGSDKSYIVSGFRKIAKNQQKFAVVLKEWEEDKDSNITCVVDLSNENSFKVIMEEDEYVYLETDLESFIFDSALKGRYIDEHGIGYVFKDTSRTTWGDHLYFYDPWKPTLNVTFDALEIQIQFQEDSKKLVAYTHEDDNLCLYDVYYEEDGTAVRCKQPFAVLTNQDEIQGEELKKQLQSIWDEMDRRQLATLTYEDPQTKDLFERLFYCITYEWYSRDFVDKMRQGKQFYSEYYAMRIFPESDETGEYEDQIHFGVGYLDVVECGTYYDIKAFHRDSKEKDKFLIDMYWEYDHENEINPCELDFQDETRIKITEEDGEEYLFIGTDIKRLINDTNLKGSYQDQNGVLYEFTEDYHAIWGDYQFDYDPSSVSLYCNFDAIWTQDVNGYNILKVYAYEHKDGKLYLYDVVYNSYDQYDEVIVNEKPFAVLTKIK